jgi:hypothetical protein
VGKGEEKSEENYREARILKAIPLQHVGSLFARPIDPDYSWL